MAGDRALVNETQVSLLDDGPRTDAVSDHLDYKEPADPVELRELESLGVSQVARLVGVVVFVLMLGDESVEVDVGGEVGHVFAEVVIGVDLEDLDLDLLDVLDVDEELDGLVDGEAALVVVSQLDVGGVLELAHHRLPLARVVYLQVVQVVDPRLEKIHVVLTKLFGELLGDVNTFLDLEVLQVGLDDLLKKGFIGQRLIDQTLHVRIPVAIVVIMSIVVVVRVIVMRVLHPLSK